ncbi:glycosyltransferase family 5 protein [Galdieria sulphuraria]|uniref:Glycosyltransferase family 5 protein n=1 Tax=Galdieria sulphuraria TaxID=130081 RepID=M2W9F3_GALSU|nr:glycosyltransferase family 5 protein [Galdieria sulphuraria]EME32516.1 glycosyltransferase family 5 protein [Galdieria sulphuraria]|eukprot:XP_005709036.1 glycosyltransferase family 5 protein [Galdieria sulphuraria]
MRQAESLGKINYSITESQSNKYILIQYQPPVEYFRSGQDLFYTGGYNNWSGVDNPLILPLRQKKADLYEVLVPLPEGSVSVEFAFTDGVVYDTNHGAFYHIPLEQFVTEEENNSHHIENVSENTKLSELDPLKIPEGPTRYTNDEEIALRKARAEATAVGESMGLSNVLMTEARTEFERFDTRMSGWISREEAKMCIERLGFEIGDKEFHEWTLACKEYSRDEDMENIHITEFIYLYGSLELRNEGLQIL